jgi:hypothetical protein
MRQQLFDVLPATGALYPMIGQGVEQPILIAPQIKFIF